MIIIANEDRPGVIGEVGTILGRHGVNIASFALGRNATGAIGVVNVDEDPAAPQALDRAVEELRKVPAIRGTENGNRSRHRITPGRRQPRRARMPRSKLW